MALNLISVDFYFFIIGGKRKNLLSIIPRKRSGVNLSDFVRKLAENCSRFLLFWNILIFHLTIMEVRGQLEMSKLNSKYQDSSSHFKVLRITLLCVLLSILLVKED